MKRGFPSMTALLGLLAVAGYQNRDKIAEMLGGLALPRQPGAGPGSLAESASGDNLSGGIDRWLRNVGGSTAGVGSLIGGGLRELIERFKQAGQGEAVESWVGTGTNRAMSEQQLEQAIGPDILATLAQQTGLSRAELLARLSRDLPTAVDSYTPQGRIPADDDSMRS